MIIPTNDVLGNLVHQGGNSNWIYYTNGAGRLTACSKNVLDKDFDWNYSNHVYQFAYNYIQQTDFLDDPDKLEDLLLYCVQTDVKGISILYGDELVMGGEYAKRILKTNILARGTEPKLVEYILANKLVTLDKILRHLFNRYSIDNRC